MPGRLALPCDAVPARWPVSNPGGLRRIAYRVGDFAPFRHALLRHLDGETELAVWRPTAGSDLGLQVVDWWAYVADILTFYNERIANEAYLGTAHPRRASAAWSACSATGRGRGSAPSRTLAVIASGPGPLVLPAGLAIASKAAPGSTRRRSS